MSYVLDALRKADAERERGAVPGLHAQPVLPPAPDEAGASAAGVAPWVAGALAVGAAAVAWWMLGSDPAPAVVATAPVPAVPAPAAPAPKAAPVVQAAAPAPAPALAPAPAPVALPPIPPSPPAAPPAPRPVARETPAPAAVAKAAAPAPAPRAAAPAAATAPAPAPAAEPRILSAAELPEEVRRALPPLRVGGSIYSDDRAARFVIVDGRVLHEGEEIAPGLAVEQIRLKSAVLRYRDWRWAIAF